jgi:hypothetical protein
LFRRLWEDVAGKKKSAIETVKTPGKADLLKRFFWSQLDDTEVQLQLSPERARQLPVNP